MPDVPKLSLKEQRDMLMRGVRSAFGAIGVPVEQINVSVSVDELRELCAEHCSQELAPHMIILASFAVFVAGQQMFEAEQN